MRAQGGLGTFGATGIAFEQTVSVLDSTGRLLSQGASQDGLAHNFTIGAEVTPHMTGRGYNPTRQDFHAYYNYSAERFNNTWNSPFWNSQVSPGFSTASLAGAAKKWANPATGVVHMYHTGRWGGWQYQVSTRDTSAAADSGGTGGGAPAAATDSIMFACRQLSDGKRVTCPAPSGRDVQSASERYVIDGGFQECRGANIGSNQFYVENIEEECVAASSAISALAPLTATHLPPPPGRCCVAVPHQLLLPLLQVGRHARMVSQGHNPHVHPCQRHGREC